MKKTKTDIVQNEIGRADVLVSRIEALITEARTKVVSFVNTAMVYTYYEIGRMIVEDEQGGEERAEYGKKTLQKVSERLTDRFGKGWSYPNLRKIRQFYLKYSKVIISDYQNFEQNDNQRLPNFKLPWTHYLVLMNVDDPSARSFYEIEAAKQQWSVRQLQRQIGSSLFERLALSRNKDEIIRLAKEGQTLEKPSDIS